MMSPALIILGLFAYLALGLAVLVLFDNSLRHWRLLDRMTRLQEYVAIALWPVTVCWLLWMGRIRGRA